MKELLKKIFPVVYLKRAFLVFNKIKIRTWDKLIYRTYKLSSDEIIINQVKNPFLDNQVEISHFTRKIREGFLRWTDPEWVQDQYLISIDKTVSIDPETGWAVLGLNKLIYYSLGFSHAPYVKKPSVLKMLFKRKKVRLEKVISLRDTGEENYFHFYNDVLTKLYFAQEYNLIEDGTVIVISEKLSIKPFFKFYLENTYLKQWKWHVQKDEWITVDHIIFCKPYTHTKRYFVKSCHLILPFVRSKSLSKRIFLTRSKTSFRFLENDEEIRSLLMEYEFTIVESSTMPFLDQVSLFNSAETVIAVHGAGLSNLLFRDGKSLSVLELFHPNEYLPFHYILLCKIYGYRYDALQGQEGRLKGSGGFQVDIEDLTKYCLSLA